jgi:penicillin-binding protein 1A
MKKRKRRVRFIEPVTEKTSYLGCFWYAIKAFFTGIGATLAIPLNVISVVTGILLWLMVFGLIAGGVVYKKVYPDLQHCREVAYDTLVKMNESDFSMVSDTEVYDKDGNQIGLINSGHFEYAEIDDISMKIQNGYIAVEDKRFKTHPGFDWISIARAGLALVKNNGEVTQGGSTITQQVIKNTYLTQEQSFTRKITEILLAPELEKKFSKAKIMEFYCNTNFYGHRCYGVEAASNYYFGKSAKDVDWDEAAILIGLSNAPSAYDPVNSPEKCIEKRNRVLDTICKEGYITEEELAEYKAKPLNIVQEYAEGTLENYQTSYAIHCAAIELMKNDKFKFKYTFDSMDEYKAYTEAYKEAYDNKSELIRTGGYKIYTTLDSNIQNIVQSAVDTGLAKFIEKQDNGKFALQGAAVVVDNNFNNVVAIVGGRGADDLFNRGYLAVRQPGSTIKPLIDYAPAFDTGEYYPSKIMNDHKWEDGPSNAGSYHGNVTVREALNRSLNTVAWQVLQGVGVRNGLDYLGEMEFRTLSFVDNSADAVSIGGFTNGTRVVDMAKGYSTLANDGIYSDKTCITSIVAEHGGEVYSGKEERKQVYEEDTAYMITDILKGTMDMPYGTGHGLDIPGQQAAGKTGTTNSNKDAWFCGYTKYYTTAVWMGYDTPKAMPGIYGATYSGRIWNNIMTQLHQGLPEVDWERPETVITASYDPSTGTKSGHETGLSDLFSTTAEIRAEESRIQREKDNYDASVSSKVDAYVNTNISSVEEVYLIEDNYHSIMTEIALVNSESLRAELGKEASQKYQDLLKVKDSMKDAIDEYEANKIAESEAVEESKALEAEQKLEAEALALRVGAFKKSVKAITDMKWKQDNMNDLFDDAYAELEKLVDVENYDSLLSELETAIENAGKLPTKAEYDRAEAEKKRIEESKRAEEESRRAAELEEKRKQLEEESRANVVGPGYNVGPGHNLVGPGYEPTKDDKANMPYTDPLESAAASTER